MRLADVLKKFPNPIRVEGHTDNLPIRSAEFLSNWELSAGRAATVVHLLMSAGVSPQRMSVIGLSEYRPVADNNNEKGRNRNRRVQLIIPALPAGLPKAMPVPAKVEGSTHDIAKPH